MENVDTDKEAELPNASCKEGDIGPRPRAGLLPRLPRIFALEPSTEFFQDASYPSYQTLLIKNYGFRPCIFEDKHLRANAHKIQTKSNFFDKVRELKFARLLHYN